MERSNCRIYERVRRKKGMLKIPSGRKSRVKGRGTNLWKGINNYILIAYTFV